MTLAERIQVFESTGWRSADADELAAMCADDGDVSVIGIPRHLLKRWWDMAERNATDAEFKSYSLEIAQYFQYKNWSIPTVNVLMSVVAAGGKRDEALVPSHPMRFAEGVGTLIAAVNLDDENAAIAVGTESAKDSRDPRARRGLDLSGGWRPVESIGARQLGPGRHAADRIARD